MRRISKACALWIGVAAVGACSRTDLSLDDIGDRGGGSGGASPEAVGSTGGSVIVAPMEGAGGGVATSSGAIGGVAASGGFANGGRTFVSAGGASTIVADAATAPTDAASPADAAITPTHGGTCATPIELPLADDVWWEARWTDDAPLLPSPQCGDVANRPPTASAVVAKWVAAHDGYYEIRAWSRDFQAVISNSARCGDARSTCGVLYPMKLPAVPFDVSTPPEEDENVQVKAGDVLYLWFQNAHVDGMALPDRGTAVVNIRAN
ncbi:MAG TPA: hypothetical protein VHC69_00075 [Polyangiaceae bacterium]|nr:hypothetical protein [Polyangiaceae bacterium]